RLPANWRRGLSDATYDVMRSESFGLVRLKGAILFYARTLRYFLLPTCSNVPSLPIEISDAPLDAFSPFIFTPPCSIKRRASPFEAARPVLTSNSASL